VRIVAAQIPDSLLAILLRHVRPKLDFALPVERLVALGRGVLGEMRRPQRQHQEERVALLGPLFDETTCIASLRVGIVAWPVFRLGIVAFVIEGMVVIVGALAGFPVLEAEPVIGWNVGQTPAVFAVRTAIEVPLADITCLIACFSKGLTKRRACRLELLVVDEEAAG
jgi:hypothetical protein